MFYLATSNHRGQPYIQYKGGAPGFLKIIDSQTLAWADFTGNRQYISAGNLEDTEKAFIFLMDYSVSRRVKIWGTCRVVDDDPALLAQLSDREYPGSVERAFVFTIKAWDANCPQHIHKRFPEKAVAPILQEMATTIEDLKIRLAMYESADDLHEE